MTISSRSTFLADLHRVLDADRDGLLLLVDKQHPLPGGYEPVDLVHLRGNSAYSVSRDNLYLRESAEAALRRMGIAAAQAGVMLLASSTYRSQSYQVTVYNRAVAQMGQAAADRESARPGHSQHQLGTVVDFGSITEAFAATTAGTWLAQHAAAHGWSLSFPPGLEAATGYLWEPWHWRYIGIDAVALQSRYFSNTQQYMLEFLDCWAGL
jgi:D-alanyl-D-alanine carboxypeptidase